MFLRKASKDGVPTGKGEKAKSRRSGVSKTMNQRSSRLRRSRYKVCPGKKAKTGLLCLLFQPGDS